MYKTINLKEKNAELDNRISNYWKEYNIAEKSLELSKDFPNFIFFEGPPTANGKPGIHHVLSRTIKDSVCRYKTMSGFNVRRKAGWDTHGLPVEIEVEKKLGLEDKKQIENFGIEKFCKECKNSVFSYEKEWRDMTEKMGYWIDLDNPYITLKKDYIETVWWILNDFFTKDLLYKGHKIVPYCPSCGTPLSSHEVAQGYKDVEDPSVFVKFKVKNVKDSYFLAWTTTPWTLISNVALAVNPEELYVKVKINEEYLFLAKALLHVLDEEYVIIEEIIGKDLEYKEYEQLFSYVKPDKKAFYICCADYVSMSDGTGIVHTAPAFGQDDYNLGRKYDLPIIQPVDQDGKFDERISDWKEIFVKDADKQIIRNIKDRGLLYKRKQILHSYPHCWRCSSPLIYYARESWYIKTSQYKQQMIENNKQINWHPAFVGEKRFGEWLENNIDWALSRDRFWGTPLNVWVCDSCGETESVGSVEELCNKGKLKDGSDVPVNMDLHRPYIDDVVFSCDCGGTKYRTPEVIDCWFDSGAMPFAQQHYPFENKEYFDNYFPADFIAEGIDQTRGWFYSLLAISTILTGKAPYKNVLVNDLILDSKGIKMSKSKGNTIDPILLMDKYGVDAIRWYLFAVSPPWIPTKFDNKGVEEIISKFLNTFKNIYSFYATYANIDNFSANDYELDFTKSTEIDNWIVSVLHSVIKEVIKFNDSYDFTKSVRLIQSFILDDVSNWYVRRSRRRFWEIDLTEDKKQAYLVLNYLLENICKLIAPFAPFIAEEIYIKLTNKESVHFEKYPKYKNNLINEKLEKEMKSVIELVSLGRAARNSCQIKVRQTLSALYIPEKMKSLVERMESLIIEEINVKEINYISENDDFVDYLIKPNFKIMGPKFGKDIKIISKGFNSVNANDIVKAFKENNEYKLFVDGKEFIICQEDIEISINNKEGYVFESSKDLYVALDVKMTPELIEEGYAREVVNKVQYTRKENNFEIMDKIKIFIFADSEICNTVNKYGSYIKDETLCKKIIVLSQKEEDMESWDINGKIVFYKIEKI